MNAEATPNGIQEDRLRAVILDCVAATARQLGIHKTTLWRKMKRYGID